MVDLGETIIMYILLLPLSRTLFCFNFCPCVLVCFGFVVLFLGQGEKMGKMHLEKLFVLFCYHTCSAYLGKKCVKVTVG